MWVPNKSRKLDSMGGVDLACIVYSTVPAEWNVWLKTDLGHVRNITTDRYIIKSQRSGSVTELLLQIRNATEQDTGNYTCRAQFGAVIQEESLQLVVTGRQAQVIIYFFIFFILHIGT